MTLNKDPYKAKCERNLGEQPIARIMAAHNLTANAQAKVLNALNAVSGKEHRLEELFNY